MSNILIDQCITFLYTRDLAQTEHFYEHLLGLELARAQEECRIYRVSRSGFLGFCQRANAPEQPQGICYTFVTDQVDEWYKRLRDQGVAFEKPPASNEKYQIYHSFLRDPNGYLLEIQQFLEPLE